MVDNSNEIEKENLLKYYKYVYTCKCGLIYGSDKEDRSFQCPKCDPKGERFNGK
jgi:rubrerythrin